MEWERIDAEREEILAWGRVTGMLREVVQYYRFERHVGRYSHTAHQVAAKRIEEVHPTIPDPLNYAGVLIGVVREGTPRMVLAMLPRPSFTVR